MFKPISKSDDKQQKISKLVIYSSNFKVLTDPLKTFRGHPGVRGPPVENHWRLLIILFGDIKTLNYIIWRH